MRRLIAIFVFVLMPVVGGAWAGEGAPAAAEEEAPAVEEVQAVGAVERTRQDEIYENYERLGRVMEIVQSRYVKPIDGDELFEGALRGVMESLDPYSSYISPKAYKEFVQETEQSFSGIGVTISQEDDKIKIVSTIEGMPAFKAGVQPGDYIVKVEGEDIRGIGPLAKVARKLKGPKGTKVNVTFYRPTTEKEYTVALMRADIPITTLRGYRVDAATGKWDFMLDGELKIGYIRITKFSANTVKELDEAYKGLVGAGLRGLVIDLRYNPGGLLDSAVAVVNRFIDDGLVVRTQGRAGIQHENFANPYDTYDPPLPLVLLVNEYSASASEVTGGALKDYGRAVLVGTRTFGKGSVQNIINLEGHGALRLTVAYYYTPSGRLVHRLADAEEWGLDPDVEQAMTMEEQIALREEWGRVAGGEEPKSLGEGGEGGGAVLDVQLGRAVDIIRGGLLMQGSKVFGEAR